MRCLGLWQVNSNQYVERNDVFQRLSDAGGLSKLHAPFQIPPVSEDVRRSFPAGAVHPVWDGSGVCGTATRWRRSLVSDDEEDERLEWHCNGNIRRRAGLLWNAEHRENADIWRTGRVRRRTDSQHQLQVCSLLSCLRYVSAVKPKKKLQCWMLSLDEHTTSDIHMQK